LSASAVATLPTALTARKIRLKHPARQVHRDFNLDPIPFPSQNDWQHDIPPTDTIE
jgi:hypothetical protein